MKQIHSNPEKIPTKRICSKILLPFLLIGIFWRSQAGMHRKFCNAPLICDMYEEFLKYTYYQVFHVGRKIVQLVQILLYFHILLQTQGNYLLNHKLQHYCAKTALMKKTEFTSLCGLADFLPTIYSLTLFLALAFSVTAFLFGIE